MKLKLFYLAAIEIGLCLLLWGLVLDLPSTLKSDDRFEMLVLITLLAVLIIALGVAGVRVLQGKAPKPFGGEGILTELSVMRLLKNRPSFILPAIFTIIFPLITLSITIKPLLRFFVTNFSPAYPVFGVIVFFFVATFIVVMLQAWGMLLAGELLQRHFKPGPHSIFVHMIKNTIFALPFSILYSLVFVFVMLLRKKGENSAVQAIKTTGIIASLQVLKYYIYANLSMLAFEDKYTYTTLRDSAQYLRANAGRLLVVFASTAVVTGLAILYLFVLVVWADKIPFFDTNTVFGFVFITGGMLLIWMLFVEQVLFLLNFIQVRHPEYNVYALVGEPQPAVPSTVTVVPVETSKTL